MNIRQLDNIVSWLLQKFKYAPYRWNEQQVHYFCEFVGLTWAIPIVTIQTIPKQRSQNYQQEVPTDGQKFQIPLLDICTKQYEQILEVCTSQSLFKMISHSIDINLYYQIQKLKIWSLILLKYQNYREILKKLYGSKLFFQQKCKTCTAEISCSCSVLSNIIYEIEIYIKSIYEMKSLQNHNRKSSMFISSDIINLLLKSISHLPQIDQTPLFWDMDDIKALLYVIKFQDYYQLLYQNQIDGFVLLLLVNPPFKGEDLFLKCLLLSQEGSQKSQNNLVRNRSSMVRNTMQTASKYHQINQLVNLLHYLLQILSFTAYKNQESYNEYRNIGQRKVSEMKWLSLYYFSKAARTLQLNRSISLLGETRSSSKSLEHRLQQSNMQRHKTEMIDIKMMVIEENLDANKKKQFSHPNVTQSAKSSPQSQRNNQWMQLKNYNTKKSITGNQVNNDLKESVLIQDQDQDYIDEQDRDLQYTETNVQIEEDMESIENVNQSQEEQTQQLTNQEEYIGQNEQMQQSVLMIQSVIQQYLLFYSNIYNSNNNNNNNNNHRQCKNLYLWDNLLCYNNQQYCNNLNSYNNHKYQINQFKLTRLLRNRIIKEQKQILQRLQVLSLTPIFDPFQLFQSTHLKLKCDEQQKLKIVNIQGAYFGRSDECTFAFTDHSKISSKHCQIFYKDKAFYLLDVGSKGGTFIKINHNFVIEKNMSFYIGNRFAFKILEINTETGFLEVRYEHEGAAKHKQIYLKKGDKFLIGRERSKNNFTFMHSQCNKLMSARHLEINYDYNFKIGSVKLMINDLESKNGTWLRLSEKQLNSSPMQLQQGTKFNLSFEIIFDVVELVCDV
ncbi:unnamed protein product [Paramecium octaurelia]|uniref:FHA domain-containing protein n=1 Tax=Paramecium octaurelia TaxID=43137 RepID=A0A8S1TS30_PAROT|nr:unnamed protein product [Paramecium octaurelia]